MRGTAMSLVSCIRSLVKSGKKIKRMKNKSKRGKSARNGNAPSPYTKQNKVPYRYSFNTGKIAHIHDMEKEKEDYRRKKKAA